MGSFHIVWVGVLNLPDGIRIELHIIVRQLHAARLPDLRRIDRRGLFVPLRI